MLFDSWIRKKNPKLSCFSFNSHSSISKSHRLQQAGLSYQNMQKCCQTYLTPQQSSSAYFANNFFLSAT